MKLEFVPVIRYWEYNSKEIFSALERAKEYGASSVAAWVPWSHLETDRFHLLQKFLKQASTLNLRVKLGVTPELTTGYPSGGIPEELMREHQNYAQDRLGQTIYACAPPNIHPLVSLLAPQVFQRYGHFLLKFSQELHEVIAEGFQGDLELVLTDSFFKHYRNTGLPESDHGDYSIRHLQVGAGYRKDDWTPALAERIFHSRALDFLESRFNRHKHVKIVSHRVFAREISLERLVEELCRSRLDVQQCFERMTRSRGTCSLAWFDDLASLSDRERNFLISSTLTAFGELWISEDDYLLSSQAFRRKLKNLAEGFASEETELSRPAVAFTSNRFAPARITSILQQKLGTALRVHGSLSEIEKPERKKLKLFAVEEGYQLEFKQAQELFDLAREQDCTAVFFRSSLCELAQKELQNYKSMRLNHGWIFEVTIFPSGGNVLVIEGQENSQLTMETLGDSLLNVARISPLCSFDRSGGLFSLCVDWTLDGTKMKTFFLMNPTAQPKPLQLDFRSRVRIHGLQQSGGAVHGDEGDALGKSFETSLPPLSVIPLSVVEEAEEIRESDDGTKAELA